MINIENDAGHCRASLRRYTSSIVFRADFKVALAVEANRAYFRSFSAYAYMAAVAALPYRYATLAENFMSLHIAQQSTVALVFSMAATPRNCSARAWKPSSSASLAKRSYMSVHS